VDRERSRASENFVLLVDGEVLLWNPGPIGCAILAGKQMIFHQVMQLVNKASTQSCKSDIGIDVSDVDVALGWQMVPHVASLQYLAGVKRHKTDPMQSISSMNKAAAGLCLHKLTQYNKHILEPVPISTFCSSLLSLACAASPRPHKAGKKQNPRTACFA